MGSSPSLFHIRSGGAMKAAPRYTPVAMRLDLFLKQTGLIKRRPVAKAMCDANKVARNDKAARASDEVREGDTLRINYGIKTVELEVLMVPIGTVSKAQRTEFYRITKEEREEDDIRELISRSDEPIF
jgi:ribosomal 50S subunit-recycling heat shock protein